MTGDEKILYMPPGYRFVLLFAAYLKYALQLDSDPRKRLDTLEMVEALCDGAMLAEAIKVIAPMPDLGVEIMHTAFQLDRDRDGMKGGAPESYRVLTQCDVFTDLVKINPSIMNAIEIYSGRQ